jgi:hypothetical protein
MNAQDQKNEKTPGSSKKKRKEQETKNVLSGV